MSIEELLKHVPPAARYRREPLADDQNALSYWNRAAAALVEPDDGFIDRCHLAGGDESESDGVVHIFNESQRSQLWAFVEQNRQVFDLLRSGVRYGRVQFHGVFDQAGDVGGHAESLFPVHHLPRVWLAHARLLIAEGQYNDAAQQLVDLGQMGHMLCCGESFVLHYLIGGVVMGLAQGGIRLLVAERNVPAATRRCLVEAVDRWIAEAGQMTQCLRVDLCCYALTEIDHLMGRRDVDAMAAQLVERHYQNEALFSEDDEQAVAACEDDGRRAWRLEKIAYLLGDHPDPFDPRATVRQMGHLVADRIADLQRHRSYAWLAPWRRFGQIYRRARFQLRTQLWPAQFRSEFPYECLGTGKDAQQRRAAMRGDMSDRYWAEVQPPSDAQLKMVKQRLRRIPNPFGALVAETLMPTDVSRSERLRRERLDATRRLLVP